MTLVLFSVLFGAPSALGSDVIERGGLRYTLTSEVIPGRHTAHGLRVAREHWGVQACPAGITWKRIAVEAVDLDALLVTPSVVMAADPARCTLWAYRPFLAGKRRAMICTTIVHEVGHLLGHGHDEGGVMAASLSRALPACKD